MQNHNTLLTVLPAAFLAASLRLQCCAFTRIR